MTLGVHAEDFETSTMSIDVKLLNLSMPSVFNSWKSVFSTTDTNLPDRLLPIDEAATSAVVTYVSAFVALLVLLLISGCLLWKVKRLFLFLGL